MFYFGTRADYVVGVFRGGILCELRWYDTVMDALEDWSMEVFPVERYLDHYVMVGWGDPATNRVIDYFIFRDDRGNCEMTLSRKDAEYAMTNVYATSFGFMPFPKRIGKTVKKIAAVFARVIFRRRKSSAALSTQS